MEGIGALPYWTASSALTVKSDRQFHMRRGGKEL